MRAHDWEGTTVGVPAGWDRSLKTAIQMILGARHPMFVWWGRELLGFYNDAYVPILGQRHPAALARPASEVWSEVWHIIGPWAEAVLREGRSLSGDEVLLPVDRNGYTEEAYFTYSYSPINDDTGSIAGVFCACSEETGEVLGRRRLQNLGALGAAMLGARSAEEVCQAAARHLAENRNDVPFVLLYLLDETGSVARLAGFSGLPANHRACWAPSPEDTEGPWPIHEVNMRRSGRVVDDVRRRVGELVCEPWAEPIEQAIVLPVEDHGLGRIAGALVLGISPRLRLDAAYRNYLELAAAQIGSALTNAGAHESERRRAEALAEIDRAKTTFFSNVSHEFRTPLTMMLGPLEELALGDPPLTDAQRTHVDLAQRSAERLLKLVKSLLDFARIEAGRIDASYVATDLARMTSELAGTFRSAIERAGLRLDVDCLPLSESMYVDHDMWEKIVLNLLSNALKFTFDGEIAVSLRHAGDRVILAVRDTGTGIPASELPRIFERFHRVQGARARTHEGAGIGLALVQDLVRLHGGEIEVESEVGRGSTFRISLRTGAAHLPADRIGAPLALASTAIGPAPFLEEALRWLPEPDEHVLHFSAKGEPPTREAAPRARILVVDDNTDMRGYLHRLLAPRWDVTAVPSGMAALTEARRSPPDLVLCDVMMPGMDGFALLRALRQSPRTSSIPIVMLSARAGEAARVEGLDAGADDYVIKPFSARELLARVASQISLSQARSQAKARAEAASRAKDEFLAMLGHELRNPLSPILTALELMRLRNGSTLERERAVIERQVQHLVRLVDDLLDVSRIARGKIELRRRPLELTEVVAKALEQSSPLIEQRGHTLRVAVPAEGLVIDGDEMRLAQVVGNLLTNAAKYTDKGGHVEVSASHEEGWATLRVRDSGIGIPPDLLPRIFDLFVQGGRAIDRSEGGLGLGLAIVKNLTEAHGGHIEARSAGRGLGSEFIVRLPLTTSKMSAPPRTWERRVDAAPAWRCRVLVVDDNQDAAVLLAEALRAAGYETRVAFDGPSGLDLGRQWQPEVAVLDIGLPVMDGYELAGRLRELSPAPQRLLALSGYAQPGDRDRARAAGFSAHLVKPVEMDTLYAALSGVRPRNEG
ncbi:ATP-binding response regulator [Polyangium mundeleinium]|uniref:histidine kinase n=1 Tax=Polyangium mundeleinium TaxID=2995306 RepID=A0ABT5ER20_9BACT|nr:ATP-binding protein [Polyangium mundeleinium]MDC0743156.1 ATP-binding protein [Polyangium mundeleinium]